MSCWFLRSGKRADFFEHVDVILLCIQVQPLLRVFVHVGWQLLGWLGVVSHDLSYSLLQNWVQKGSIENHQQFFDEVDAHSLFQGGCES